MWLLVAASIQVLTDHEDTSDTSTSVRCQSCLALLFPGFLIVAPKP